MFLVVPVANIRNKGKARAWKSVKKVVRNEKYPKRRGVMKNS
jgi:hypothetical protein